MNNSAVNVFYNGFFNLRQRAHCWKAQYYQGLQNANGADYLFIGIQNQGGLFGESEGI